MSCRRHLQPCCSIAHPAYEGLHRLRRFAGAPSGRCIRDGLRIQFDYQLYANSRPNPSGSGCCIWRTRRTTGRFAKL